MDEKKESLGNILQKKIQNAAGAVKSKAEEIEFPEIGIPDGVREIVDRDGEERKPAPAEIGGATVLSTKSALQLIYYVMAVNGVIDQDEKESFDLIGAELDPAFEEKRDGIVRLCQMQVDKAVKDGDYYEVIQEGVFRSILASKPTIDSFITPKLLIWDLITIAYSDGNYDEAEKKLIRYIVNRLNVNEAEFLEMESSFLTLVDVQNESEWIKTTDRPYKRIELVVNELADRKAVILESVNDLITL